MTFGISHRSAADERKILRDGEKMAAGLGYELKRNQVTRRWHWQIIDSIVLDWHGSGFATKADANRAFWANAQAAGVPL